MASAPPNPKLNVADEVDHFVHPTLVCVCKQFLELAISINTRAVEAVESGMRLPKSLRLESQIKHLRTLPYTASVASLISCIRASEVRLALNSNAGLVAWTTLGHDWVFRVAICNKRVDCHGSSLQSFKRWKWSDSTWRLIRDAVK